MLLKIGGRKPIEIHPRPDALQVANPLLLNSASDVYLMLLVNDTSILLKIKKWSIRNAHLIIEGLSRALMIFHPSVPQKYSNSFVMLNGGTNAAHAHEKNPTDKYQSFCPFC